MSEILENIDLEKYKINFIPVKPAKFVFETSSTKRTNKVSLTKVLHSHLDLISNAEPIIIEDLIFPTTFRSEWKIRIKGKTDDLSVLEARLILELAYNNNSIIESMEIENLCLEIINGPKIYFNFLLEYISTSIDNLRERSLLEFSKNFIFQDEKKIWIRKELSDNHSESQ